MESEKAIWAPFEADIREIFRFACKWGLKSIANLDDLENADGRRRFLVARNEGFAEAQSRIVRLLLRLQDDRVVCEGNRKDAAREKNRTAVAALKQEIAALDYQIAVTRKLADAIAWQMIGVARHYAHRLYIGEKPGLLRATNLDHVQGFVNDFNARDCQSFALMTDITSFIQIGDILVAGELAGCRGMHLIELKEGAKNERVRKMLDSWSKTECGRALQLFRELEGEKAAEHLVRMAKQMYRMGAVTTIGNAGTGKDPATDMEIEVPDRVFVLEDYDTRLARLFPEARQRGWAIDIVDGSLFIGVYTPEFPGRLAFDSWVAGGGIPKYPVFDLRWGLLTPAVPPVFVRFPDEGMIMDIVFGRVIAYMYLDLDQYFVLARNKGASVRWLSKKETAKSRGNNLGLIEIGGRGIEFSYRGSAVKLSDGILARILYEGATPASTIDMVMNSREDVATATSHEELRTQSGRDVMEPTESN